MDHTVENKHFPGVFEATPLRAPVRPWGHAPRQANPVLTQGRRGAQGRDTPPHKGQICAVLAKSRSARLGTLLSYYIISLRMGKKLREIISVFLKSLL